MLKIVSELASMMKAELEIKAVKLNSQEERASTSKTQIRATGRACSQHLVPHGDYVEGVGSCGNFIARCFLGHHQPPLPLFPSLKAEKTGWLQRYHEWDYSLIK